MTRGESVQPLQSVKLIYQPCSRSRAAWTSKCWFAWMESRWGAQMGSECWFQWFSEEKEDLT